MSTRVTVDASGAPFWLPGCAVAAFLIDGSLVAAADRRILRWDVTSGELLGELEGPEDPLALAAAPGGEDGPDLLVACRGRWLRRLSATSGATRWVTETGRDHGVKLALDPSGGRVLVGCRDGRVRTLRLEDGQRAIRQVDLRSFPKILCVAPGGRYAAALTDAGPRVWQVDEPRELLTRAGASALAGLPEFAGKRPPQPRTLGFSPDGECLWLGFDFESLLVAVPLDPGEPPRVLTTEVRRSQEFTLVPGSPGGVAAALGMRTEVALLEEDGRVRRRIQVPSGTARHSGGVGPLCASPDGAHLVSRDCTGRLWLYALPGGREVHPPEAHRYSITGLSYEQPGPTLVTKDEDGVELGWVLPKGSKRTRSYRQERDMMPVIDLGLAMRQEERQKEAREAERVRLADPRARIDPELRPTDPVPEVLRVVSETTGRVVLELELGKLLPGETRLTVSPSELELVLTNPQGQATRVRLEWIKPRTLEERLEVEVLEPLPELAEGLRWVEYSPDGAWLAMAGESGQVRVLQLRGARG